jgi:hypothetical protein
METVASIRSTVAMGGACLQDARLAASVRRGKVDINGDAAKPASGARQ